MYLLFPAARRHDPSAEYVMAVKDLVPGAEAAVRREVRERPPETSRRASSVASALLFFNEKKVKAPSSVEAASCCASGRIARARREEVSGRGSEDWERAKGVQRRIVLSHEPEARVVESGVKVKAEIGPS